MEQVKALRSALNDVPLTLLTSDTAKVLDGVYSSLDIIERSEAAKPVVVLVGPTGAGKSYVFNAIVGAEASPEGVLRPTTSSVVIAGDPTEGLARMVPDAVVVPNAESEVTLVDLPEGDEYLPDTEYLVSNADLAVLVVSPIRYADAAVAALWESLDSSRAMVVLNRVATTDAETEELLASVTDVFGAEPYVIGENGAGVRSIADHIVGMIPSTRSGAVASIMFRAAGAGARFVVREVTNAAPDIGKVTGAVDEMPDCAIDVSRYDVQVSWDGTRDAIMERVAISIRDRDDTVMRESGTRLAERILDGIGPWDGEELSTALDAWRDECISAFSDSASVRWRRSNAQQLIERFSWSTSINPEIVSPKRFSRIMGARLGESSGRMRSGLEDLICGHLDARLVVWRSELSLLGEFQPGVLAAAAGAIDDQRPVHD